MARPYRLELENTLYHVTNRGDDKRKIFISKYDYEKFLEYVKTAKEKYNFYLYAYCLMDNHYHLLIETTKANLSKIMQYINTAYTSYYNVKRKKCGHVFQGRYKSIIVDKDSYLLELTRYIHLNPVKAKMVDDPISYIWSSMKGYLSKQDDGYIDRKELSKYVDIGKVKYKQFVLSGIDNKVDILSNVYGGLILGKERFVKDRLKDLQEQVESQDFAYKRKLLNEVDPEEIIELVSKKYKMEKSQICGDRGTKNMARKIAIYLLKKKTDLTNKEIGDKFNISATAAIKVYNSIRGLMGQDSKVRKEIKRLDSAFSA